MRQSCQELKIYSIKLRFNSVRKETERKGKSYQNNSTSRSIIDNQLLVVKGTVPPDFSPLVFFFKQLLLAPVDKPSNDLVFFRIFVEIFDFFGASPVSLTPAKQMIL
jgi:hypothetical protein